MNSVNTFCSHCGSAFAAASGYPRNCGSCGAVTWSNPRPVGVAIVPLPEEDGVLLVERAIRPHGLALPGGFMETGQTWRENVARELREETGLLVDPALVSLLDGTRAEPLVDVGGGNLLIFATVPPVRVRDVEQAFVANAEVSGWTVGRPGTPLVFPVHQQAMEVFLAARARMSSTAGVAAEDRSYWSEEAIQSLLSKLGESIERGDNQSVLSSAQVNALLASGVRLTAREADMLALHADNSPRFG